MPNRALDRRRFIQASSCAAATGFGFRSALGAAVPKPKLRFGLVTYTWGHDWDLPTLIANCEKTGVLGVELRTTHAHGVEPTLDDKQRQEVRRRFKDSPVELVGLGSNDDFHHPDQARLRASIASAKAFVKLSHDVGGSGVKVKPNDLPPGVPHEKTIEQIGRSLNELGAYAADLDQQIRLEVHGGCARLPVIASIMQVADHPNVAVCWNSNPQDLEDGGLERNFRLVEKRLGYTTHIRQLGGNEYPYPQLVKLLQGARYNGWLLAEENTSPKDRLAALSDERSAFERLLAQS
jgi:sugar phosphate isomerase/epimerase